MLSFLLLLVPRSSVNGHKKIISKINIWVLLFLIVFLDYGTFSDFYFFNQFFDLGIYRQKCKLKINIKKSINIQINF